VATDIPFTVLRIDGTEEQHHAPRATVFDEITKLLNARALDTVNLGYGRVMFVDDDGYEVELIERPPRDGFTFVMERKAVTPRKPTNPKATALYHAVCQPGVEHAIVGDVAIVRDKDFDDDD
jgi:hypothetical protein